MDLEKRITNLENLVTSLIKRVDNDKVYNNADKAGIRITETINNKDRKTETSDNSDAIFELASLVAEMEESNG